MIPEALSALVSCLYLSLRLRPVRKWQAEAYTQLATRRANATRDKAVSRRALLGTGMRDHHTAARLLARFILLSCPAEV
jgi:hypothetical protein